uniref:Annexin n=1 Tax=Rhizophora mucronata TaxID=61149 RepID=A0A2P2KDR5_RHIMU
MKQLFHDDVLYILCTRNLYQLRATFKFYEEKYGIPIDQEVRGCGNGQMESMLIKVISCIDSPEKHIAEVIGNGTDEDSLTRAIVTRAEVDLMKIRGEYFNMFQSSLEDTVIGHTSGDHKHFLMTLLGRTI